MGDNDGGSDTTVVVVEAEIDVERSGKDLSKKVQLIAWNDASNFIHCIITSAFKWNGCAYTTARRPPDSSRPQTFVQSAPLHGNARSLPAIRMAARPSGSWLMAIAAVFEYVSRAYDDQLSTFWEIRRGAGNRHHRENCVRA